MKKTRIKKDNSNKKPSLKKKGVQKNKNITEFEKLLEDIKKKINYKKFEEKLYKFLKKNEDGVLTFSAGVILLLLFLLLVNSNSINEKEKALLEKEVVHYSAPEKIEEVDTKDIAVEEELKEIKEGSIVMVENGNAVVADLNQNKKIKIETDLKVVESIKSPDKKTLALLGLSDGVTQIFLYNLANKDLRQITYSNDKKSDIAFSEDGERILFVSNFDRPEGEIYSIDLDGKKQKRITNNESIEESLDVSKDGVIVFSSFEGSNNEIFVLENGEISNITNSLDNEKEPKFSSDGSKIVYIREVDGKDEIFVMDKDGSNQVRITQNMINELNPEFSPGDKEILFWSEDNLYEVLANGESEEESGIVLN